MGTFKKYVQERLLMKGLFLGGSYYVNSPVTGNWEDFITQDVLSYMDSHYRTIASKEGRIAGHSMGEHWAKTSLDYPYRNIPTFDGSLSDQIIVSDWEKGSGDLQEKMGTYASLSDSLTMITVIYGKRDALTFIPSGCRARGSSLTSIDILHEVKEIKGTHVLPNLFIANIFGKLTNSCIFSDKNLYIEVEMVRGENMGESTEPKVYNLQFKVLEQQEEEKTPDHSVKIARKSRFIAILFALFLGRYGVHKFYLGEPAMGLIYLILSRFEIMVLISFIDAVFYVFMSEEQWLNKVGEMNLRKTK